MLPVYRLLARLIKDEKERSHLSVSADSCYQPQQINSEGELTFTELLNNLQSEHGLVDSMLANLKTYCQAVRLAGADVNADRKKLFVGSRYCH